MKKEFGIYGGLLLGPEAFKFLMDQTYQLIPFPNRIYIADLVKKVRELDGDYDVGQVRCAITELKAEGLIELDLDGFIYRA